MAPILTQGGIMHVVPHNKTVDWITLSPHLPASLLPTLELRMGFPTHTPTTVIEEKACSSQYWD